MIKILLVCSANFLQNFNGILAFRSLPTAGSQSFLPRLRLSIKKVFLLLPIAIGMGAIKIVFVFHRKTLGARKPNSCTARCNLNLTLQKYFFPKSPLGDLGVKD